MGDELDKLTVKKRNNCFSFLFFNSKILYNIIVNKIILIKGSVNMFYLSTTGKLKKLKKNMPDYWVDSYEDKTAVKMPYKYVIEMLCDMIGAGYAYNQSAWQPKDVKAYWKLHDGPHRIINPETKELYEFLLDKLEYYNDLKSFVKWYKSEKKVLKSLYKSACFSRELVV